MQCMVASSIQCKLSVCADRAYARAGDSYVSSAIDVVCPTTQSVFAIASPHELHGDSWPSSSTGTSSFCCNQQYSVTAVTTSTGAIAERYTYSAYGQPRILDATASVLSNSTINNRYTYTGREWDATLGLHHFRARWMSPNAGRFLTRDPIGYLGRSLNLQQYVRGRVTRYIDPIGTMDGDVVVGAPPIITIPTKTNCIGFCLHPTIDYVSPSTTIKAMLDHFKMNCDSGSGAADACLKNCQENLKQGGEGCSQFIIYIQNLEPDVVERVRRLLQQLQQANGSDDYEFLLSQIWAELNDELGLKGGYGSDPLDIHMNKCLCADEYIYQSGACDKKSPKRECNFFKPTPKKPEMIDPSRILYKACCCKGGGKLGVLPPSSDPVR